MKYIAILRGINVSGQKSIKMVDLKHLFESQGLNNIVTYIQSGNVIFECAKQPNDEIRKTIEKAIVEKYGFEVPVCIRSYSQWKNVIASNPLKEYSSSENDTKLLVTFLSGTATAEKQKKLHEYVKAPEELCVNKTEVYLYCPGGYGRSKLINTFVEDKLGVTATTRNWKSVLKIAELAG